MTEQRLCKQPIRRQGWNLPKKRNAYESRPAAFGLDVCRNGQPVSKARQLQREQDAQGF